MEVNCLIVGVGLADRVILWEGWSSLSSHTLPLSYTKNCVCIDATMSQPVLEVSRGV